MAAAGIEAQSRGSAEFAESSVLEAIVPSDLSLDIQQELNSWDGAVAEHESGSILPFLPQREVVLLGKRRLFAHQPHVSYLCIGV